MADNSNGSEDLRKTVFLDDLGGADVNPTELVAMWYEKGKDWDFMPGILEKFIGLGCLDEEEFEAMIVKELENLPKDDYLERLKNGELDVNVRKECLEWIWKAHTHYDFTDQCFALAVNYYDRFMSLYEMPRGATWAYQLLAVACLSLAAKMEEVIVPLTVDLQVGKPKALFDSKTIQRMELMVLNGLGWKLHACTPCTFIYHFVLKMTDDQLPLRPLIAKAVRIIPSMIKGIEFLDFKPCEIAAAVALSVLGKKEAMETDTALSCFKQAEKDNVFKCVQMIHDSKLVSLASISNGVH